MPDEQEIQSQPDEESQDSTPAPGEDDSDPSVAINRSFLAVVNRYVENLKNAHVGYGGIVTGDGKSISESSLRNPILLALSQVSDTDRRDALSSALSKIASLDPAVTSEFRRELGNLFAAQLEMETSIYATTFLGASFSEFKNKPLGEQRAFFENPWFDTAFKKALEDITSTSAKYAVQSCSSLLESWPKGIQQEYKNQLAEQTMQALEKLAREDASEAIEKIRSLREGMQKNGDLSMDTRLRDLMQNTQIKIGQLPEQDKDPLGRSKGVVLSAQSDIHLQIPVAGTFRPDVINLREQQITGLSKDFGLNASVGNFFYKASDEPYAKLTSTIDVVEDGGRTITLSGTVDEKTLAAIHDQFKPQVMEPAPLSEQVPESPAFKGDLKLG